MNEEWKEIKQIKGISEVLQISMCNNMPLSVNEKRKIFDFIIDLQQKVEQLEKENEYLKMSNPEQNMEHFRIVNENKRKIDMLRKENHQLENIRKEAIEWIDEHDYYSGSSDIYYFSDFTPSNDLLNILNKGDNNE